MLLYYLLFINLFSFIVMFIDKALAIRGKRRISENFIFLGAFLFGSLGIYFAMYIFKHKTRKYKFYRGIPILIILQLVLAFYLYTSF